MIEIDNAYTHRILGCAYDVHTELGPGLLESVYEKALIYALKEQGFYVHNQVNVPIKYHDTIIDNQLRLDILIDNKIIIEIKSVQEVIPVHSKQLYTYLRLTNCPIGYLINFNTVSLKEGITRIINPYAI